VQESPFKSLLTESTWGVEVWFESKLISQLAPHLVSSWGHIVIAYSRFLNSVEHDQSLLWASGQVLSLQHLVVGAPVPENLGEAKPLMQKTFSLLMQSPHFKVSEKGICLSLSMAKTVAIKPKTFINIVSFFE
jgi:hypothetical protein